MPTSLDFPSEDSPLEPLDGRAGPALPLSQQAAEAAVEAAVKRAMPARGAAPRRRRVSPLLLAAALGVTGVAAAFVVTHKGWLSPPANGRAPAAALSVSTLALRSEPRGALEPLPATPSVPAGSAAPADLPKPSGSPAASVSSTNAERAGSGRATSALDLLKAANQLRRQGRWAEAERAYSQVASGYASTAQGPVAALAAASLRLEHLGDPRGALGLYQSARRASSLSAEAELGIADCYRALGDRGAEIAALHRLTAAHPEALFHERALRRLQALEAGKP